LKKKWKKKQTEILDKNLILITKLYHNKKKQIDELISFQIENDNFVDNLIEENKKLLEENKSSILNIIEINKKLNNLENEIKKNK